MQTPKSEAAKQKKLCTGGTSGTSVDVPRTLLCSIASIPDMFSLYLVSGRMSVNVASQLAELVRRTLTTEAYETQKTKLTIKPSHRETLRQVTSGLDLPAAQLRTVHSIDASFHSKRVEGRTILPSSKLDGPWLNLVYYRDGVSSHGAWLDISYSH